MLFPALDGLLVRLIRPALGLLEALPQGFEQTARLTCDTDDSSPQTPFGSLWPLSRMSTPLLESREPQSSPFQKLR